MATALIALLWLGFAATHMGLSSPSVRPRLVGRLGEGPFLGLYSLISFLFFVPLVWVYFTHKHAGPWLWSVTLTDGLRWAVYVVMGVALVMAVAGLARPSPASILPGSATPRGIQRITRHPLFMGLGLFGAAHLIPNGSAADVVFFGGFPLFALVGSWHQDQRKRATNPQLSEFFRETPFFPFTGRETLRGLRELSPLVVVAGVAATILLRYYHRAWFGG